MLLKQAGKVGKVSDDAVATETNKTFAAWYKILDKAGARMMDHLDIMAHLKRAHGINDWWSRLIAVGYERDRGLRRPHEKVRNSVSRAKTIHTPAKPVWKAWMNASTRDLWLPGASFETLRRDPDALDFTWPDGSHVGVRLLDLGAKTKVVVTHGKLTDAQDSRRLDAYWLAALARLKRLLER